MLKFCTFFDNSSSIIFENLQIRDGNRPDSPLIGRFCERNTPPVLRSSTNMILVRFRSDASVSFGGFRAKYESGKRNWRIMTVFAKLLRNLMRIWDFQCVEDFFQPLKPLSAPRTTQEAIPRTEIAFI